MREGKEEIIPEWKQLLWPVGIYIYFLIYILRVYMCILGPHILSYPHAAPWQDTAP